MLVAVNDLAPAAIPVALLIGFFRQSEHRLQALVDAIPDRIIRITRDGVRHEHPRTAERAGRVADRRRGRSHATDAGGVGDRPGGRATALDDGGLQAFDFPSTRRSADGNSRPG